jgi:hypothetical protein
MATLKHSIKVDIRALDFRLSSTLRHLDLGALAKAKRAEIAIGEFEGGCCSHTVFALIRKGQVVRVRAEECPKEERTKLSKDNARLIARAIKRLRPRRRAARKLPLPVATFFGRSGVAQLAAVQILFCFRICIFNFCVNCCQRLDDPSLPVVCGRLTIDTTVPD